MTAQSGLGRGRQGVGGRASGRDSWRRERGGCVLKYGKAGERAPLGKHQQMLSPRGARRGRIRQDSTVRRQLARAGLNSVPVAGQGGLCFNKTLRAPEGPRPESGDQGAGREAEGAWTGLGARKGRETRDEGGEMGGKLRARCGQSPGFPWPPLRPHSLHRAGPGRHLGGVSLLW